MKEKKDTITGKVLRAGAWQVMRRTSKMLPFGGTLFAAALASVLMSAVLTLFALRYAGNA